MPGKVKVKIISGKNLPVMDRSSDTTDAYVEIKLGNTTYKTDVCRRTLHPQWNTDWYRFEVDDSELQDEPLQIRLMDHDTYSANDAIGKVYLNLNPLLLPVAGELAIGDNNPHHEISGWIPVYDTMHGIRGEVNVTVKVELFSDFNRFRQSSCGVHFFYSQIVPQGYQAKVINGFVEELIVDDDPEYQWIDKIRTPRASNEARQTLFFKLSGELQRKIGVKALSLGGNAVIGYKQCFDLEGESGIVARGIGTAVTLVKINYNLHHAPVEVKEEDIEKYLKFVGDGNSFSLCSTSPPHKFHFSHSLFNPLASPNPNTSRLPKLTNRQHSLDYKLITPSVSNPDLNDSQSDIKVLLEQEDKRGKSAMSRRFQKFKHSQKSLSKKMIALKAKLNDSIGEESDEQSAIVDKRKLFKRTSSDSSAMAEILARSVIRATTSLSSILEDQPHSSNEEETIEKLEPIANLLSQSVPDIADVQSSTDSSSSCSEYDYRDYTKSNNDVETLSNIINNVEKLQRCLSREGLHKQYSLPAIPTKGFSLSSLDNLGKFESVRSSISNLSEMYGSSSDLNIRERCCSDVSGYNKPQKLLRSDEIDLQEEFSDNVSSCESIPESNAIAKRAMLSRQQENEQNRFLFDKETIKASQKANYDLELESHKSSINKNRQESRGIIKTALQTMLMERADLLGTPDSVQEKCPEFKTNKIQHESKDTALQTVLIKKANLVGAPEPSNLLQKEFVEEKRKNIHEPTGIVKTALQTMLIERADLLGTPDVTKFKSTEILEQPQCAELQSLHKKNNEPKDIVKTALETMLIERADMLGTSEAEISESKNFNSKNFKNDHEPRGIVKTALETMLIERADLLGPSDPVSPLNKEDVLMHQESSKSENKEKLFNKTGIKGSKATNSLENLNIDNNDSKSQFHIDNIKVIAPVSLENITIEPKKMVKTAMQTMLLEKLNLLGAYTPPTSPISHNNAAQNTIFTFTDIDSKRKIIPKSSSMASFKEHTKQRETVLGIPFTSLSSLSVDHENEIKKQRTSFLSDSYLHKPIIDNLKKKAVKKKRFKFRLPKADEHGKNIFQKFQKGSKKTLADDIMKDTTKEAQKSPIANENILSRIFYKPIKDESTQPSTELLNIPPIIELSKSNSSNNLPITKNILAPTKPPSHKDLASGDFLAHSKTKSACLTSHHSSPAQERQDQNGGDSKDEHSPDRVGRLSHSPVKVNYMMPLHRRSSDSDISITPKGNSLTGSDKSVGNNAAYFMRNNYLRRGQLINQEHLDMLEYPFLTMTKFPPRFILQIGGSISARSVKLLERILNVDEPESRDIWWSEIRMEIRSHARSLNCNAVLGYTELTSICDDVCILSACGTAAVVDFNSSAGDDDNFSNVQLIHKIVNGYQKITHDSPDHRNLPVYSCCITHLPYDEKTVPVKAKVSKCSICLKGKVPEVIIATIEPPESILSIGKGCFIESHVSRPLKDLRGELIAKEISDGLPFLEYELHSLKVRITVGEKMVIGVATGTALYLSCLPAPDLPMLVTGKVSDEKFVADLQEMLNQTVKKNKELYQIKDENPNQKILSDEDFDEEQASLDISCGNKDCCILEMDDPEDAEVLRLLMQEKVPDGFHVVSTESVPGLDDLEIVKNLQMFTQIYRAKLAPPYNLQKHFVRLLQSVYFKLRRMVPCALCDLQFRIDIPEPDEIQLCIIGMALGLGKKVKKIRSAISSKKEEDLIFKLDEDPQDQLNKSHPSSLKMRSHRSPSKHRSKSVKQRHIPYNERHGVDITPLSYVPGGNIEQYLGNLNFFFIRETTSIREEGGLSGFVHSFITEVLAIVRSNVTALGGNALVAFFMTECVLNHNLHKNQGQCLINVGGDVVSVSYFKNEL